MLGWAFIDAVETVEVLHEHGFLLFHDCGYLCLHLLEPLVEAFENAFQLIDGAVVLFDGVDQVIDDDVDILALPGPTFGLGEQHIVVGGVLDQFGKGLHLGLGALEKKKHDLSEAALGVFALLVHLHEHVILVLK